MIDTEIRLDRTSYEDFCRSLNNVDMQAISSRDQFIDGIDARTDENGTLILECPDFDFGLGILQNDKIIVEVAVLQEKTVLEYKDIIHVAKITDGIEKTIFNKKIKEDSCYTQSENSVDQNAILKYAA